MQVKFYPLSDFMAEWSLWKNNLPDNVFYNTKKKTTVLIKNNKVVKVKCDDNEQFSKRIGFLEAYFQLNSGMSKTASLKYLEDLEKDESNEYKFKKYEAKNAKQSKKR